jgi:hypothetical protein
MVFPYFSITASPPVLVMWTQLPGSTKYNHFVPLLECNSGPMSTVSSQLQYFRKLRERIGLDVKNDPEQLNRLLPAQNDFFDVEDSTSSENSQLASPETKEGLSTPSVFEDNSLPFEHGKTSYHSVTNILEKLMKPNRIFHKLPLEITGNEFFIGSTSDLLIVKTNSKGEKRIEFADSLGAFGKTSIKNHCYVLRAGELQYIEKTKRGFTMFNKLMDPQPQPEEIFHVKKRYNDHSSGKDFQRRLTIFHECPAGYENLEEVFFIEYKGNRPLSIRGHGNKKDNESGQYLRTDPKMIDMIKKELKDSKPAQVYTKLKLEGHDIRNTKVIRNIQQKISEKKPKLPNFAQQVQDLIVESKQPGSHIKQIISLVGEDPSAVIYSDAEIEMLKAFCTSQGGKKNAIMGIDRTFNLGNYYATCTVFAQPYLTRAEKPDVHPLMVGPCLLHKKADFQTFHAFISHVQMVLGKDIDISATQVLGDILTGSDEEMAIRKAIKMVFPGAQQVLCTLHLKDNIQRNMREMGMTTKEIGDLLDNLNALSTAQNEEEYDHICQAIRFTCFNGRNDVYLENTMQKIKLFVWAIQREEEIVPMNFKNNLAESANNLLKYFSNHEPQSLVDIVKIIENLQKIQYADTLCAMYGQGNYKLIPEKKKFLLPKMEFAKMNPAERFKYFKSLVFGKNPPKKTVTSNDGTLTLENSKVKTKLGQKKSLRTERTNKFKFF